MLCGGFVMKNKLLLMVIVVVGSIHHVSCSTNNDWDKDLQRGRDEGMLIIVKPEGTDYKYVAIA